MAARRRWAILVLAAGMTVRGALLGQDGEAPQTPALVTSPMPFIGVTPCRIADTRDVNRPPGYGPPSLSPGTPRSYTIAGQCGIPSGAQAVSLNVTVVNPTGLGYVLLYPQGGNQPGVSTLNYTQGTTVANAAIVPLGTSGGITVAAAVSSTDFIIDTNGYFGATAAGYFSTFLSGGNPTMTDDYNTGAGFDALLLNTTGWSNTALGWHALRWNTTGSGNTAAGKDALPSFNGGAGNDNSALGGRALNWNAGSGNTAVGEMALGNNVPGSYNTAVGGWALNNMGSGIGNIALGASTGQDLTSGNSNIYLRTLVTPSSENVTIRVGDAPGVDNRAFIGGIRGASILGNALGVFVDVFGQLGTAFSSRRYKEDIRDLDESSSRLLELRPVRFRYRDLPGGRTYYGLIAEEVASLFPELVVVDADGRPQSVRYQELPALLLEEIQRQQSDIEAQDAEAAALEERAGLLKSRAEDVARRLERLRAGLGELDTEPNTTPAVEVAP